MTTSSQSSSVTLTSKEVIHISETSVSNCHKQSQNNIISETSRKWFKHHPHSDAAEYEKKETVEETILIQKTQWMFLCYFNNDKLTEVIDQIYENLN